MIWPLQGNGMAAISKNSGAGGRGVSNGRFMLASMLDKSGYNLLYQNQILLQVGTQVFRTTTPSEGTMDFQK